MVHKLKGREFKLLLNPASFTDPLSKDAANAFLDRNLKPAILQTLGSTSSMKNFGRARDRRIRFWDTADCLLTRSHLNLRLRQEDQESDELTLKLRPEGSDKDLVANRPMSGKVDLEEDIGPKGSRFALSTEVEIDWVEGTHTIDQLESVFATIKTLAVSTDGASYALPLQSGPLVRERVVDEATVMLEEDVEAGFDLTIWNFPDAPEKRIAEISFSYKLKKATAAGNALADELFKAVRSQLSPFVNTQYSSKTALALPNLCARI